MGAAFLRCGPRDPVPGVPGVTSCPAVPGPGPAQAGCDRSVVTARRLSPVHRHIATVTGAAARPGTGQRAGRRRLVRGMRHREPLARPRRHQAALTPKSRTHATSCRLLQWWRYGKRDGALAFKPIKTERAREPEFAPAD